MYISKIKIKNFRNFKEKEVEFKEGINVLIGHNNAGKTNLLKALALVLDFQGSKRLVIDDFHKSFSSNLLDELKKEPPKVSIEITIKGKHDKDNPDNDDLVTVSNWLTKLDAEYEALLTYEFFLPEKEKFERNYENFLSNVQDVKQAWKIIEHDFLRYYVYRVWGGKKDNLNQADSESLQKFDFQFLDAIRDVERDMFSGRNTLLRDVMNYFLDHEDDDETKKQKKDKFRQDIAIIIDAVQERLKKGKEQIQSYARDTGASFNGNAKPDFDESISEQDIFAALRLIIRYEIGIDIPISHNGLGYNNLVFMSLLLAKMQSDTSKNYKGSNAKVFSILSIEEPEAHLHPSMQYKFLKFLDKNKGDNKVRQIFVTTHSTHITSAVQLDDIICLHNENGETLVGYPGKVFPEKDPKNSKKYVQRFLDATKSDMLFAQKVILVEGLAEQLLIPILVKFINAKEKQNFEQENPDKKEEYKSMLLEDNHIAVVNVGGRYFEHFLYLFNTEKSPLAINKKVVCITDRDPVRKKIKVEGELPTEEDDDDEISSFTKCFPFEYGLNAKQYEYKFNGEAVKNNYKDVENIEVYFADEKGKTLEYDLAFINPSLNLLLTGSIGSKTKTYLQKMTGKYSENLEIFIEQLWKKDQEILKIPIKSVDPEKWTEDDRKNAIIASLYLKAIGKGENALDLSVALEENLSKKDPSDNQSFQVPQYIKDAIQWICK